MAELCIHGHFYQPPREDPFTGKIPRELSAAPYANWNRRISAECYAPNADKGNFEALSFNLGNTLARWMETDDRETYKRIRASERAHREKYGASNALAQSVHHTILPLARRRDKICQVRWGIASYEHTFGHRPEGMWLPEMAVDTETLQTLAAEGIRFTILTDEQVRGRLEAGSGPYRISLPDGNDIAVFVRDRHLSNSFSFQMPALARLKEWVASKLDWRIDRDGLILVATDGETFGHHHRQGVAVLEYLLKKGEEHGYTVTTLGRYLQENPPEHELALVENTSWSCYHGIERWAIGCDCTPGDGRWKAALRRALDNLAGDLDLMYLCEMEDVDEEPWSLRDDYIAIVLGEVNEETFLDQHGLGGLGDDKKKHILQLLEAQFYRQRMYSSCAFFFEDLDRLEPRYAIAHAVRAMALTKYATGENFTHSFHRDLAIARSGKTGKTGSDILEEILQKAKVDG